MEDVWHPALNRHNTLMDATETRRWDIMAAMSPTTLEELDQCKHIVAGSRAAMDHLRSTAPV